MFKISFLTLFPNSFEWLKQYSIIKNALEKHYVEIEIINFRDWSKDKHKKVDDYQFGGGPGMVIGLQAICDCLQEVRTPNCLVYLLSPSGMTYNQNLAKQILSKTNHLILICGHYEGFDYRIHNYIDGEISIGDFVVSGGEIPSMVIADSLIRLIPNVISTDSLVNESFENYLLDYPVYTKPQDYDGHLVPDVLLSGNHQLITDYRYKEQLKLTKQKRKDLYLKYIKLRKEEN